MEEEMRKPPYVSVTARSKKTSDAAAGAPANRSKRVLFPSAACSSCSFISSTPRVKALLLYSAEISFSFLPYLSLHLIHTGTILPR